MAKAKEVSTGEELHMEVYMEVAFVPSSNFTALWTTPQVFKRKEFSLKGPDGQKHTGVLVARHAVPERLPHFIVKLGFNQWCRLKHCVLQPEAVVRGKQAKEKYDMEAEKILCEP